MIRRPTVYRDASYGRCHRRKVDRAEVTTDGQVSLSNGTLQRKRTGLRALGYARCGTFGERHRPNSRSPLVLMVENALS